MLKIKITFNGEDHEITPADARKLLAELQEAFGEPEQPAQIHWPNPMPTSPWLQPLPNWSPGVTWTGTTPIVLYSAGDTANQ